MAFTIAVTGHRDMVETASLRKEISDFFDVLINEHTQLTLLSPLAIGADTLVAKIFLEKKEQHPQLKLDVPLPFDQAAYEETFSEEEKSVFLSYLKQASTVYIVPKEQEDVYANLGAYIVNHADILLALWDGTMNFKEGGTGDVVAYAKEKTIEIKHFLVQRRSQES